MSDVEPGPGTSEGLSPNLAATLAYLTIVPAILFLLLEPYSKMKLVKFHALQSIFLCLAVIVVESVFNFLFHLSIFAALLWPLHSLLGLAILAVFVACMAKAYRGEYFKLPVVGDLATQQMGR